MIKHKEALYEIFDAERQPGQSLENKCKSILKTSSTALPNEALPHRFITLGGYTVEDVPSGNVVDKYTSVLQDIVCGAAVDQHSATGEVDSEDDAYELARLVRTILKNNRKLISTTYPTGAAKTLHFRDAVSDVVVYSESPCNIVTITIRIQMLEDV